MTVNPLVGVVTGSSSDWASNIIHGGETNYIMATVTLYVSIFNPFPSLPYLLGFATRGE